MPLRLLRHPLGGGFSAAAVFAALHGDDTDVFWLDSGAGGHQLPRRGRAAGCPTLRCWMPCGPSWPARSPRPTPTRRRSGWVSSAGSATSCGARRWACPSTRTSRYPDAAFLRVDRAVAIDADGTAQLLALGESWDASSPRGGTTSIRRLSSAPQRRVSRPASIRRRQSTGCAGTSPTPSTSRRSRACQQAIREGEAYQLCLTTEASVDGRVRPGRGLRPAARAEPQPPRRAAAHRRGQPAQLQPGAVPRGASRTAIVRTHPIKGTRPRDPDAASDARLARRAARQRQGARREHHDRRPDAQRPRAGQRAGQRDRAEPARRRELRRRCTSWSARSRGGCAPGSTGSTRSPRACRPAR